MSSMRAEFKLSASSSSWQHRIYLEIEKLQMQNLRERIILICRK